MQLSKRHIGLLLMAWCCLTTWAQTSPQIYYSSPREYAIADIAVEGIDNYEDYVLIGISGLSVGQRIRVPGDEITDALKRFWRHGLFSDVQILADKIEGDQIWLRFKLAPRPRISAVNYNGMKKGEREDLEARLNMVVGNQITPNLISRAETLIKKYYDDKGFKNAEVSVVQRDDHGQDNQVIVDINVDKHDKVKVNQLIIEGNDAFTDSRVDRIMKKTNQKGRLINLFRSKKFVDKDFAEDKFNLIQKYNEYGYRDAMILEDSVYRFDKNHVNVYLKVDEGRQYFIRDITWVGNTVYSSDFLDEVLQIEKGDVYNQKRLNKRLNTDEDEAVANLYMDNGYLFFHVEPVEVGAEGDSIDLEMRVYEGKQATISRIEISGNDRLYEHVIRRELYIKPGQLFNKTALMRSAREIVQTGHFDAENMGINPIPNYEDGTVDIDLSLTPKANDQVEFSLGYGSTGVIGSISFKFTNFSIRNLLNMGSYKHLLPQGDGETLTLTGRTNGRYYQSYSFSFTEPWLGGKRPNSLQLGVFYSYQTGVSDRYYRNMYNNYMNYYNYYGMGGYDYTNYYEMEADPNKFIKLWGGSVGIAQRLTWPDDYFQLYTELAFQQYLLRDWPWFVISNGKSNDFHLGVTLSRNSIDNPLYPHQGSTFSLSLSLAPPYSLFDGRTDEDYAQMTSEELMLWQESYKLRFNSRTFTPLSTDRKLVLATRFDIGLLDSYNKYKKTPFGAFYMGGDGMTGYSSTYAYDIVALRGYGNGDLGVGYLYERMGLELRYPLVMESSTTIYATAFVEGGNLWNNLRDYSPFQLKRSAGVGVRVFLPMLGLLGVDWAYGFDKVSDDTGKHHGGEFHFVLGQEF
ncbi:MAG: outer membrane protein assembly factor BamA [Bacteroidales bacterium]|nr:outer membrane protein assembly factor BamA [Bacteroidales bacterium]